MELPATSPIQLGLTEEGLPQLSCEPVDGIRSYLGFDPMTSRLVEIHQLTAKTDRGHHRGRSLNERIALAKKLYHPGVAMVIESGTDSEELPYVVTEFVDGERLLNYLRRTVTLPQNLGIHLVLQLAETVGYLAEYPRLLATVNPEDFVVTLERGRHLRLRLSDLGLGREDRPVTDSMLGSHWIEIVGLILQFVIEGRALPSAEDFRDVEPGRFNLGGPLGNLIYRLRHESGSVAIRELKNLNSALLEAAGFTSNQGAHLSSRFRSITHVAHRPAGPIALLIGDSTELNDLTRTRWRIRNDIYPGDGFSPYILRARSRRAISANLEERGDPFDLMLLPPERLVGNAFAPRLNHQMGHSYLKEHPCLIRTRSLICDGDFTLIAGQGGNGFSLMELVSLRVRLSPNDAAFVLEEIIRLLAYLDGADIGLETLDPWRILFHFDEPLPPETILRFAADTPLSDWPAVVTRLRPIPTTESLIEPEAGSWRHLLKLLEGKSLPALILWSMEGARFDRLLAAGRSRDAAICETRELKDLFEKAAAFLDPADPGHRTRFLELFRQAVSTINASVKVKEPEPEIETVEAELLESGETPKKRGWLFGRPLSAA